METATHLQKTSFSGDEPDGMTACKCGLFMDMDIVAAMNISRKLPPRFRGSRGGICEAQSGTFEQAITESGTPLAVRIADMSKSSYRGQLPITLQNHK